MADNADKDSDSTNKPKLNKMVIGLVSFLGLFFIVMIVGLVMIIRMPTSVPEEVAVAEVPAASTEKGAPKAEAAAEKAPEKAEKTGEKKF